MVKRTSFLMERPVFQNRNHTEAAVKVHGGLFNLLTEDLADELHCEARPKPFSLAYLPDEDRQYAHLEIGTLTNRSAEVVSVLENVGNLQLIGSQKLSVLTFEKSVGFSERKIEDLISASYITLQIMTPATYRDGQYRCWFDLDQLLRTPIIKLRDLLGKEFVFDIPVMEQIRIVTYQLTSKAYNINGPISGMTGTVTFEITNSQTKRSLCELLHYCEFTGLGAKTALGMGACRVLSAGR